MGGHYAQGEEGVGRVMGEEEREEERDRERERGAVECGEKRPQSQSLSLGLSFWINKEFDPSYKGSQPDMYR